MQTLDNLPRTPQTLYIPPRTCGNGQTFDIKERSPMKKILNPAQSAVSVPQFAIDHGISRSLAFAMIKAGTGPAVTRAGRRVLITAESAAAWRAAQTTQVAK